MSVQNTSNHLNLFNVHNSCKTSLPTDADVVVVVDVAAVVVPTPIKTFGDGGMMVLGGGGMAPRRPM